MCGVEINPYCREVLLRRQEEGFLPPFPIWDDVRTFDGRAWRGKVDVVTGGFPCQPFSAAGKGLAEHDVRNMWPDTIRIIREVGPRNVLLENVPALLAHEYFGTIIGELQASGYCVRWKVISAAEFGAPHRRDRVWIVGDTADLLQHGGRGQRAAGAPQGSPGQFPESGDPVADPECPQRGKGAAGGRDLEGIDSILADHREEDASWARACGEELADSQQGRRDGRSEREGFGRPPASVIDSGEMADPESEGPSDAGRQIGEREKYSRPSDSSWWESEPALGGTSDGLGKGLDRPEPHE